MAAAPPNAEDAAAAVAVMQKKSKKTNEKLPSGHRMGAFFAEWTVLRILFALIIVENPNDSQNVSLFLLRHYHQMDVDFLYCAARNSG